MHIKNFLYNYNVTKLIAAALYGAAVPLLFKYYPTWIWLWYPIIFTLFIGANAKPTAFKKYYPYSLIPFTIILMVIMKVAIVAWNTWC